MKHKFLITPLQARIDRLGAINKELEALTQEKERIVARLTKVLGTRAGLNYRVLVYDSHGYSFDTAKLKRTLGSRYEAHRVRHDYRAVRTTSLETSL